MSLEEEILLTQFGQGVRSAVDLLNPFTQLDEKRQRKQFVHLYGLVNEAQLTNADIDEAMAACSFQVTDELNNYINPQRLTIDSKRVIHIPNTENPPEGRLDKAYELLLQLFKLDYQRRYTQEKGNPDNWRYWDLSNAEVAQGILTTHQALVDELYNSASFRSEFASMAKLWYMNTMLTKANPDDPAPKEQFTFLSYEEMVDQSIKLTRNFHSIAVLRHSLWKALAIHYKLTDEQTTRLVFDVLDRHLHETYNSALYL